MSRWLPLTVFAALALLLWLGLGRDPRLVQSPLIDKPAPVFALPTVGSPTEMIDSSALAGQPYILNVWGSWCYACQVEHAAITQLAQSGRAPVYGLNWKDTPEDARRWLAQFGDPYVASLSDQDGRVGIDFGVYGAPETFVVDGAGIIRYKHIGPITEQTIVNEIFPVLERFEAGS